MSNKDLEPVRVFKQLCEKTPPSETLSKMEELFTQCTETEDEDTRSRALEKLKLFNKLCWGSGPKLPDPSFKYVKNALNKNHHGMQEVKDVIIEYLSVIKLQKRKAKPPILLLVGPPGVGKTSLSQSIACALQRPHHAMQLGGKSDIFELSGSPSHYKNSTIGGIIDSFIRSKSDHPVILLDEIDKIGKELEGPLLGILDYGQNNSFVDSCLAVPYDISGAIFIATANSINSISQPLLSRMEVIELPPYSEIDKINISQKHIIPTIIKDYGLKPNHFCLSRNILEFIIRDYTSEGGVRKLNQILSKIGRKTAREVLEKKRINRRKLISRRDVVKYLGPAINKSHFNLNIPGTVCGLAYTGDGGIIIQVQASIYPSNRPQTIITGLPGAMTKESATICTSWLQGNKDYLGVDMDVEKSTLHLHYPECTGDGVDGPSAGVTMITAIISFLKNKAIPSDISMTGEIDLNGSVLRIGGLNEKIQASIRGGKTRILVPKGNEVEVGELPGDTTKAAQIIPVETIKEVLAICGLV